MDSSLSEWMAPDRWLVRVGCLSLTLFLSGCGDQEVAAPDAPPREVEVVQLRPVDLPVVTEFVGRTASSQRVEIRTRVSGFLDSIDYREGGAVEEGDVLFQIDPAPFEAQLRAAKAELSQQQARLDNAQALLARVKPLAEIEAVAQKELDDANSRVNEAAAAVEGASARVFQAELDLGYTTITSPLSGMTGEASERVGAYLSFGAAPLTYVARMDPMWVEFSVSEAQYLTSERGRADGELSFPDSDEGYEVEVVRSDGLVHPSRGKISFADASVDARTGTILVRAELPNAGDSPLHPGQYVSVRVLGVTRPNAITVPREAVLQSPKGPYVWLVDQDGNAEQRPVLTGPWTEEGWVIRKGLASGDRVITAGSVGLRPGAALLIVSLGEHKGSGAGPSR